MVPKPLKKNGLVFGMSNKSGFTLLELLIVIALMAILGTIVLPNLKRTSPRHERESFIARFNALTQLASQQALITDKIQQVSVDLKKRTVSLLSATGDAVDRLGNPIFKPAQGLVNETVVIIPEQLDVKQFFIEGFDMMAQSSRSKTEEMWFYIIPEGMPQNVVINMVDTKDLYQGAPRPVGLVLNPFTVQFKIYDTFQKP